MREKFHIFFALGSGRDLTYAYDVTMKSILTAIIRDPIRPKHKCPALVLNKFNVDNKGKVRNRYGLLLQTTGWFALDVDDTGIYVDFVKYTLFHTIPELKVVWKSSSGKGVKAIGYTNRLKGLTPVEYKAEYRWVVQDIRKRCNTKINFDVAMGRCHQPVFLNTDRKAFTR